MLWQNVADLALRGSPGQWKIDCWVVLTSFHIFSLTVKKIETWPAFCRITGKRIMIPFLTQSATQSSGFCANLCLKTVVTVRVIGQLWPSGVDPLCSSSRCRKTTWLSDRVVPRDALFALHTASSVKLISCCCTCCGLPIVNNNKDSA